MRVLIGAAPRTWPGNGPSLATAGPPIVIVDMILLTTAVSEKQTRLESVSFGEREFGPPDGGGFGPGRS
jgi:hypothetical protein